MEVDDAAFADPAFDCYAWVEEALIECSSPDDGGRADGGLGGLAALVPRLALRSQALAQEIHGALHQLSLAGPQLEAQLSAMQQATGPLAAQLDAVHADIAAAGGAPGGKKQQRERDLEHLVALHDAKQRLAACSQALVEAARWGRNARACVALVDDPLFMDRGPDAAVRRPAVRSARAQDKEKGGAPGTLAECVREMRASLEVLKDMPGAWDRKQTMDSLCTQIESKMRTKLDRFLRDEHVDVAQLQWCLEVFDSMGRADEVRHAFCKSRPAGVHRAWFAFDQQQQQQQGTASDVDGGDKSASAAFSTWLAGFYGDVERMLQRESAAAHELFGERENVASVTLELLDSTLAPLAESFRDRLRRDFHMAHALSAFQSTSAFAAAVVQLFRALEVGESGSLDRSFGVLSVSVAAPLLTKEGEQHASEELGSKLLSVIFEPYRAIFDEYARFASSTLTDQLLRLAPSFIKRLTESHQAKQQANGVAGDEGDEDDDFMADNADDGLLEAFAHKLEDASSAVWGIVEESLQQCYAFTAGAAFPEAVEAAAVAVQQFSLALTSSMPAMRKYCNAEVGSGSVTDVATLAPPDWSKFHGALALLKACGALESDLCAMENRVRARMREQLAVFVGGAGVNGGASSPRSRWKKSHDASATALAVLADPLQIAAAVSRLWLRENPSRLSQFQQFAHEQVDAAAVTVDGSASLFDDAQRSVWGWTREVQRLTFDSVFLPIARVLETLPVMDAWSRTPEEDDGDLPTFSALPQEYITVVADRLLSLLPQLEPFAESSGLQQAFLASRGAHDVCVQDEWQRLGQLLRLTAQETLECQRIFTEDADSGEEAKEDASSGMTSATAFVDLWTAAVASGALAALLRAVCLISELSDAGARQLSADLGYFFNVLSAVGGEGSFLVEDLRASLELSAADQAARVEQLRAAAVDGGEDVGVIRRKLVLAKLNDCVVSKRQRAAVERQGASSTFY